MVSEFFKSLSKDPLQGIPVFKGMITSSLFTPVPFYCWKSKMIFGASVIFMDIAISR